MSTTPIKSIYNFIPKEIVTPNKELPGLSKTVFLHVSNLHSLLTDWVKVKEKGLKFCRGIAALKLHECSQDYYPQQLEVLTKGLLEALDTIQLTVQGVKVINDQLKALAKLQPTDQPVISTWSASHISNTIDNINSSLIKEFKLKQVVVENIAHCRDENLIEVYISSWEWDVYIDWNTTAYLFAECGLNIIT